MYTTPQGSKSRQFRNADDGEVSIQDHATHLATQHTADYVPYPIPLPNENDPESPTPTTLAGDMQQMSLNIQQPHDADYTENRGRWADDHSHSPQHFERPAILRDYSQTTKTYDPTERSIVTCNWPNCSQTFSSTQERDRHSRTVHANKGERTYGCTFSECPAGVTSWTRAEKLREHNKTWHGPYTCPFLCARSAPNGFKSQALLDDHIAMTHKGEAKSNVKDTAHRTVISNPYSLDRYSPPVVQVEDPFRHIRVDTKQTAEVDRPSHEYKVHQSKDFVWGKIVKCLWTEPTGSSGFDSLDLNNEKNSRGSKHLMGVYEKVRRFVIIRTKPGHSICLPITTYGGQGTMKKGVHARDHAIVYPIGTEPKFLKGENAKGLTKRPIAISLSHHTDTWHHSSRLNYAKVYTIEHNIKVAFIGKVHKDSEHVLAADYDEVHPPITLPTLSSPFGSGDGQQWEEIPRRIPSGVVYDNDSEISARYGYGSSRDQAASGAASFNVNAQVRPNETSQSLDHASVSSTRYQQPYSNPAIDATSSYNSPIQHSSNPHGSNYSHFNYGSGSQAYTGTPSTSYYQQYESAGGMNYNFPSTSDAQDVYVYSQPQEQEKSVEIYSDEEHDRYGKKKRTNRYRK